MGKVFEGLDDGLRDFIATRHMFFVATAPLSPEGHVNVSPKGLDTFRVLGPRQVAYLDLTGSGVETVAHLRENGRITIMFCAYSGPPRILRLYGRGRAVELERVADSCGYGVPLFEFAGQRTQLPDYAGQKGPRGVEAYKRQKNRTSIDGLPGLRGVEEG